MKKLLLSLLLAGIAAQAVSYADDSITGRVTEQKDTVQTTEEATESSDVCADCWEHGKFTDNHPVTSRIVTFPVRVVTAVAGAPVGMAIGAYHGSGRAIKGTSEATFEKIPSNYSDPVGNAAATTLKAPVLGIAGGVMTLITAPLGAVVGATEGTIHGFNKGFMLPDKI